MFNGIRRVLSKINKNAKMDGESTEFVSGDYVMVGDYPIFTNTPDELNDDIYDILIALEPTTEQFRLRKGDISIATNVVNESGTPMNGSTHGVPYLPYGQDVVVRSDSQHTLIHELGHVIDRASDMEESLPWSRRSEFVPIVQLYRDELFARQDETNVATMHYLSQDEEIFAHLFEHYFKERFPDIGLGQTTSYGLGGEIAEKVFKDETVKKFFDEKMSILRVNETHESFKHSVEQLSNERQL